MLLERTDIPEHSAGPAASPHTAPPRRVPRLPSAVLVVVLILAAFAANAWIRAGRAPVHYATVAASRGTIAQAVVATGTVNPVITIQVGSYVSGVITQILCDFNTQVEAGQLCAKIDARPYQTIVEQSQAVLGTARAQLEKDRANLVYAQLVEQRNLALLKRGFVSREAAELSSNNHAQAKAQLALDQAEVAQRQAQLRAAQINLGYTNIVSPVKGTVVSRNVSQGQTVAASFQTPTVFLIATDLTTMQVDANVSEADIGQIKVGNPASFTVSAFPERRFYGKVRQVRQAPQAVQNVVTYDVVVDVPNADLALKPGMTASIRIVTRQAEDVLRVPGVALRYRPTQAGDAGPPAAAPAPARQEGQVWVLDAGRARRVPVITGLDDNTHVEIRAGNLRAGEAVIVGEDGKPPARGRSAPPGLVPMRR
jgi:HlyD family secretion protein